MDMDDHDGPNHSSQHPRDVQHQSMDVSSIPNGAKMKTKLRNGKDVLTYESPITRYQAKRFKDALLSFVELICGKIDYGGLEDDLGDKLVTLLACQQDENGSLPKSAF